MRLKCLYSIAVFIILSLFIAAGAAAAELKELARGVWAFVGENGATNSGFIVTGKGVVVIDTQGPKSLAEELRAKIRRTTEEPIVYAVNTHYHGDHAFGNQYFGDAIIIAHEKTREALIKRDEGHRAMFKKFFGEESLKDFRLTLPDITVTDRLTLRLGDKTVEIIYAGAKAHTEGDLFVWLPEEKVLFAGDLLYKGRLPLLNDGDGLGAISAIDAVTSTGADVYVPGHGALATKEDALSYRKYLEALRSEVARMMKEGRGLEEIRSGISLPGYASWDRYREWLPANAEKVYKELSGEGR